VTLSSSEAKFVALSEAAKVVKFLVQVLQLIGIEVELPVMYTLITMGAVFLAEYVTTSQCTKHIDICYHDVGEFVKDGFIKIIFVRTKENTADAFIKASGDTYNRSSMENEWDMKNVHEEE